MPDRIVFFLSTSRTGTKSLAEGLAGNGILSPHQPRHSRLLTIAGNLYLHGQLSMGLLQRLVIALREPQIRNAPCRVYAQVFSLDYFPAKIISQRHKDTTIIHIVRDPRTFVPSYLNWMHTRAKSFIANKLIPGWHPSGWLCGDVPRSVWWRMDEFQRVCWHWQYKNTLLENLFAGDTRYRRVRFENLFLQHDEDLLRKTLAFAGIDYQPRFGKILQAGKNRSKKTYCPPFDALPVARQAYLLELCGDLMKRYGYLPS